MDKRSGRVQRHNAHTYPADKYKYNRRGLAASVRRLEELGATYPPPDPASQAAVPLQHERTEYAVLESYRCVDPVYAAWRGGPVDET